MLFRRQHAPLLALLAALGGVACSGENQGDGTQGDEPARVGSPGDGPSGGAGGDEAARARAAAAAEAAETARMEAEFPKHGLVTGVQLGIRERPDPEAPVLGWVRIGSRIRVGAEPARTPTCSTGWYAVYPRGHVCAGQGVTVGDTPPAGEEVAEPPDRDSALPYRYYFVTEAMVPQYHRLPTRDEQRLAHAWIDRYQELLAQNERRAARMRAGELPNEPTQPAVVARLLERGFWLAGTGVETRDDRRFVRTVSGAFVQEARLEARTGSELTGVELRGDRQLPLAWALRGIEPRVRREQWDGTLKFVRDLEAAPIPRHTLIEGWGGLQRFGDELMHVLPDEHYAKSWFIGVADRIDPPFEVEPDEPWVHVDLSEQTLVLYRGREPVFATLVSSGLEGFATPTGTFTIQRKLVSDTMADLGPEAGDDRYRIEDVPFTQYFQGSYALHGALWHNRFGLARSHGCVNLAPHDARRVFEATWPHVPQGWHGVITGATGFRGSRVHVTE